MKSMQTVSDEGRIVWTSTAAGELLDVPGGGRCMELTHLSDLG
jgi:hypothetical protein